MASDLEKQIAKEAEELANMPKIPIRQFQPGPDRNTRCHFCGQLSNDVQLVEVIGDVERYRGTMCCGGMTNE